MSLEQQIAALVSATNSLTGEVAGKMAALNQTVEAKKAELEAWRASARAEFGTTNLLANSRFTQDTNADGFPDGFYTYFAAGTPQYATITPDKTAAAGSDARIAADLLGTFINGAAATTMKVLKVLLAPSTTTGDADRWCLNQVVQLASGTYSRGIFVHAKTAGSAKVAVRDNPWGGEAVLTEQNKPVKLWHSGNNGGESLGFLLDCRDRTAPVTLYIAAPWMCDGYCDRWPSAIESR